MPALRGMGFATEDLRMEEWWERRERVSEVVEGGWVERRVMSEVMAARGGVRVGWVERRWV